MPIGNRRYSRLQTWATANTSLPRSFPLAFLVLALLAFLGGALYAPNNYDGLAYRTPRVLHWLAEGRWHWIHTEFNRLNTRGPGFEWLSAPLIAFTRSDRLLFLINIVSFLLLPGLVFSLFTRLGVRPRVAWHWMWLVPSGYCFLLQAGSIANDLFGSVLFVAALDYGLRARQTGRRGDFWLSLLAMGLATGAKANIIPLVLVWVVLAAPCWRLVRGRVLQALLVGAVSLLVSFAPTALLNWKYCRDWTGAAAEQIEFRAAHPLARIIGNLGVVLVQNFSPPLAPFARIWNDHVAPILVPLGFQSAIHRSFMVEGPLFSMDELQTEEGAGLGLGVCALLGISAVVAARTGSRRKDRPPRRLTRSQALVFLAAALACGAFLEASFVKSTARLLCPYYPLLVAPLLLAPDHARLVRMRWWRAGAVAVWAAAALVLALGPARPLLPMEALLKVLRQRGWSSSLLARAERVYAVYGQRSQAFAPALQLLPPDTRVLGVVTFDDPETGLWRPFGTRRIVHVCRADSAEPLCAEGVRYVLVSPARSRALSPGGIEEWLTRLDAEVLQTVNLSLRAGQPAASWYLLKLHHPKGAPG